MSITPTWRRGLLVLLALVTILPVAFVGAASTTLPAADLERARVVLEHLRLSYGTTVDGGDVRRLAERLGVNVGVVVDAEDLTRVLTLAEERYDLPAPAPTATAPAAGATPVPATATASAASLQELARYFVAFGIGYGSTVDAGDVVVLASRLGIGVGSVIDEADVARLAAVAADHLEVRYPAYASVGGVTLRQPADRVELIGFHESNHDGARQVTPLRSPTRMVTLPSRDRGTGSRSAADIVTAPDTIVRAPVTGRVLRAGTYVLYCRYSDDYAVIEPDAHPGWEVKVLHIDGVRVRAGDRVEAGVTVLAGGPTPLPFRSQVDDHSSTKWPHVHIEVVDPSIPDRPSPGGGC